MTTIELRMRITALVDRIIYGNADTFSATDARDLLALTPRLSGWQRFAGSLPAFKLSYSSRRGGTEGVAAGVGTVSMPNEEQLAGIDMDGRLSVRAGQWRLYRADRLLDALRGVERIEIVQVATEGRMEGHGGMLIYRRGQPVELLGWAEQSVLDGRAAVAVLRA